jgi:hypothetical protein
VRILKRFARTIEVEVGPEYFVFRCGQKENRVLTRGYIRQTIWCDPAWAFGEQPKTDKDVPISLFAPLPPELQKDFVAILAAFLAYGVRPLSNIIRPIIILTGMEHFATEPGRDREALVAAAKLVALGGSEVSFQR